MKGAKPPDASFSRHSAKSTKQAIQLTGSSFTQYLKQYRLEIAASQLVQTDHKIAHIARRTGFQNLSYFTRSFAEQYGLPPAAYRKNHKA